MSRRKVVRPPLDVVLDRLDPRGPSGMGEDGQRWRVRAAPIGAHVRISRGRKQSGRVVEVVDPGPHHVPAPCPAYGVCGGCQLQDTAIAVQQTHKQDLVARQVDAPCDALVPSPQTFGYRNKLELSWGTQQYLPEARRHDPKDGHFLGFHPAGWWSRIVPLTACPLATPAMNGVIAAVAALDLEPAWDTSAHTGVWRHLVLRQGAGQDGQPAVLVSLVTSSQADPAQVREVGRAVAAIDAVSSVLWVVTDRLAEHSGGELREVLHGAPSLAIPIQGRHGAVTMEIAHDAFFQVNTPGAAVLFDAVAEQLGLAEDPGGTLLDLYCGVGAIGLYLAPQVERVVGIELSEAAIASARANAVRLGHPDSAWHAGTVEAVVPTLDLGHAPGPLRVVVDPPRVGLHPKAAAFLADLDARVLVYVACNPGSLGRDRAVLEAGGWVLDALVAVDLFPHTRHVEAVARFVRKSARQDADA